VTSIDDIIQPGQPIPDDVIAVRDPTLDTWCQQDDGLWDAFVGDTDEPVGGSYEDCSAAALRALYPTLTVTAVREQPAESVSGLCEVGDDGVTCIVMDADHRRIHHGGRPVPPHASTEALLKVAEPQQPADAVPPENFEVPVRIIEPLNVNGLIRDSREIMLLLGVTEAADVLPELTRRLAAPEPQQADASPLLDLVQQYGLQERQDGGSTRDPANPAAAALLARIAALVQREEADALQTITDRDLHHEWADKLATAIAERTGADIGEHSSANNPWRVAYESLAALVPQQPVQARYRQGEAWWIHECGMAVPFRVAPDNSEHHCFPPCKTPGPWRPLFVGGDPAPEQPSALDFLASINTLIIQRDEARAEVERLQAAAAPPYGPAPEERGNAELKDIVRRLDETGVNNGSASERVGYAIQSMRQGWATARNYLASLDTVKSDRETIRRSLNYLKDTVTGPAIKLLGVQHNEDIVPAIERLKATQPDPLVLSLPKVPEGTAAVIGTRGVGDEIRAVPHPSIKNVWVYEQDIDKAEAPCFSLPHFLADYGPLRVELAAPREPRTAAEVWRSMSDRARLVSADQMELAEALDREAGL
jgi:hypothetical protein